jgi:hypothetical protein
MRRRAVPLHATICRYDGVTASIEAVMRAGRQLASALSTAPGFVSYAVLDAGGGVLVSVTVFDDRTTLEAAEQIIVRWVAEHMAALLPCPPEITAGEVIVQRGM